MYKINGGLDILKVRFYILGLIYGILMKFICILF